MDIRRAEGEKRTSEKMGNYSHVETKYNSHEMEVIQGCTTGSRSCGQQ